MVDAALLSVVLMWASTFTVFKVAWRDVDPVAFTAVRFAVMVPFSLALLAASPRRTPPRREDLPALLASGLSGFFLYQMGFVLGLDRTSALASAILISTHPIFSVLFAWLLGRDRPGRVEVVGVAVGFAGVAVFLRAWEAFAAARPGDVLSLGAAAAFGAYGVVTKPLSARYSSRELLAYGLATGGVLVTLVGTPALVAQDWGAVSLRSWAILAYAVVGPVYLAYGLWNWAIHRRGVARTVGYGFLVPVLAGALAIVVLGERVRAEQVLGAGLVLAGLAVARLGRGPRVAEREEAGVAVGGGR